VSSAVITGVRLIALAIVAMLLSPHASSAQAWPSRPVTIVVPFPAGGTADLFARDIAQALSDELGQPFVVENRAGGGGNPAAAAIARMAPDGSTLLFASQAQAALNKVLYKRLAYDPAGDLTPVVLAIKSPIALIAGIDAPVKSFDALVDYAKANPGTLSVGQAGVGSMGHVAFELLQQKTGITLNAVPYKGGPPMVTDLLGGHLPVALDLLSNSIRLVNEKKVRLLAVASARRMSDLPEVPTVQERIHAPFEAAAWFAILARTGTPADILQTINTVTIRYLASARGNELIAKQAVEAGGGTPAEAASFVKRELEKWEPVIKGANIALD
jgi:tripartite-type tricarboxylate transporter receptor subunit TctC